MNILYNIQDVSSIVFEKWAILKLELMFVRCMT